MSNEDMVHKLFVQGRLHPWIPEHKHWIDKEINSLRFEKQDGAADQYQKDYDAKMAAYEAENPQPVPADAPVSDATAVAPKKILKKKAPRVKPSATPVSDAPVAPADSALPPSPPAA